MYFRFRIDYKHHQGIIKKNIVTCLSSVIIISVEVFAKILFGQCYENKKN